MATLKEEVLAAQAHAIALGASNDINNDLIKTLEDIDAYHASLLNNVYTASAPDVQALLNKLAALG